MGAITDYANAAAAPDAAPSTCPTCGGPVPIATIAKDAGFTPSGIGSGGKANIDPTPVPRGPNEKAPRPIPQGGRTAGIRG